MEERRKAQRKQTDQFFGVYDRETDEFIGRLLDMSTIGIKIHSLRLLETDAVYEFRIDLPKAIAGQRHLCFDGICVRCVENQKSKGNYEAGFQITNIEFEEFETIKHLLNDALFRDLDEQPRATLSKKIS